MKSLLADVFGVALEGFGATRCNGFVSETFVTAVHVGITSTITTWSVWPSIVGRDLGNERSTIRKESGTQQCMKRTMSSLG